MNLLQLAIILGRETLVKYIMNEHRFLSTVNRELKSVDPRAVLASIDGLPQYNDMATVTLALQTQSRTMIQYVWDSIPDVFSSTHATKFAKLLQHFTLGSTEELLKVGSVYSVLKDGTEEFIEVPDVEANIFEAIKANNVKELETLAKEHFSKNVIGGLRWRNTSEKVLSLKDGLEITLSGLNPLLVAVFYKSFTSVKYLLETHKGRGLRNYFQHGSYELEGSDIPFNNLALPILLATKDLDILSYLSKQTCFVLGLGELREFIRRAV